MDYALLRKIVRDCFRFDKIRYEKTNVLTVAHDTDRSLLFQGKYYSPLIDTIEDDLGRRGIRCVSIARIISGIKGDIAYGNVVSPEGAFARALVVKRLAGLISGGRYAFSYLEERVWGELLDATGATKVLGIQPSRELCLACHKRGVWVADIQHGVIAEGHIWYGERFRARDAKDILPDVFCCWDRGSQEVIQKWATAKGVQTLVTGNRWIARFLRQKPDDLLVAALVNDYRAAAPPGGDMPTILVCLSWGDKNIPNGFMVDGLRDVIRKTSKEIRWLIRLHPNQMKGFASHESGRFLEFFDEYLAGHAEWKLATRSALPVVLSHADLHISWVSSVSIEAAQMGIRSALLDPRLRTSAMGDFYVYYRDKGMIDLVPESENEIQNWIKRNLGTKRTPENFEEFDREYEKLIEFLAQ